MFEKAIRHASESAEIAWIDVIKGRVVWAALSLSLRADSFAASGAKASLRPMQHFALSLSSNLMLFHVLAATEQEWRRRTTEPDMG
jgi:hypothetical protein